jgi:hypothetical protein
MHEKHYTMSYHERETTCENVSAAVSKGIALQHRSSYTEAVVQCVKKFVHFNSSIFMTI